MRQGTPAAHPNHHPLLRPLPATVGSAKAPGVPRTLTQAPWASSSHARGHLPPSGQPGLPPAGSSGPGSGWPRPPLSPGSPAAVEAAPPARPGLCTAPSPVPAALPEPLPAPGDRMGRTKPGVRARASYHRALGQSHRTRPSPGGAGLSPAVGHRHYRQGAHPSGTRGPCCPSASLPGVVRDRTY